MDIILNNFEVVSNEYGPGNQLVITVQGCMRHCFGCDKPDAMDFYGKGATTRRTGDINAFIKRHTSVKDVIITGGEPLLQAEACFCIASYAKRQGRRVWLYTGYTLENITYTENVRMLLSNIDILIDGRFIQDRRCKDSKLIGSDNERIIDMVRTRNKYGCDDPYVDNWRYLAEGYHAVLLNEELK